MEPYPRPTRRDAVRIGLAALAPALAVPTLAGCSGRPQGDFTAVPALPGTTDDSLGSLTALPVHAATVVDHDGEALALARTDEATVVAFDATCPHQDCVVTVSRGLLHCPCHDSDFDPATGRRLRGPAPADLAARPVAVEGGRIVLAEG